MGHSVIECDRCGSMVMEGRNEWKCDCGWRYPNKTKQKPVWRMNTEITSDFYGDVCVYIYENNRSRLVVASIAGLNFVPCNSVYSYQTNRTKAAECERVECEGCKDNQYKGLVYCGGYFEYRKCHICNGKGYTLEKVE